MNFGNQAKFFFFNTPPSCIEGKTYVINTEWECKKIRGVGRGLCSKGGKKGAEKWNKNRLMMELVSRWGSPLTSQAPHSLAYPSPVNRRGHTTDLSLPAKSSSGEPTPHPLIPPVLSLMLPTRLQRGQVKPRLLWWLGNLRYVTGGGARADKPPARCLKPSAIFSPLRALSCPACLVSV